MIIKREKYLFRVREEEYYNDTLSYSCPFRTCRRAGYIYILSVAHIGIPRAGREYLYIEKKTSHHGMNYDWPHKSCTGHSVIGGGAPILAPNQPLAKLCCSLPLMYDDVMYYLGDLREKIRGTNNDYRIHLSVEPIIYSFK